MEINNIIEILVIIFFVLLLVVIVIYQIAEKERKARKRHFKPSIIWVETLVGDLYFKEIENSSLFISTLTSNIHSSPVFTEYENAELILEFVKKQYPKAKLREI